MTVSVCSSLRRAAGGAAAAALVAALTVTAEVRADPEADALARLNELSAEAVQTRDAVTAAQVDLEARLADQAMAEERDRADRAALEAASSQLQVHQDAVDRVAVMVYTSGQTGWLASVLTADSPQELIDQIWVQRALPAEMARQKQALLSARERAGAAAKASTASAADARAAAERSAAVNADLQAKWSELQRQIAAAEAQYAALTPQQRAVFDNPSPPVPSPPSPPPVAPEQSDPAVVAMPPPPEVAPPPEAAPPPEPASPLAALRADIPEALPVGVAREAGLQPNTILAARAISARFPQIATIDGVRPDSKPWHPNGLAIDIMIPNPDSAEGIALGDEILAFVLANAGRFGLQDVIWRNTYYTPAGPQSSGYGHFDHVHVTTRPSR